MTKNDVNFTKRCGLLAPKLIKELNKRNFEAYYCENEDEALKKALNLIPPEATVSWGGSETIKEIGLIDAVKQQGLRFIDRDLTTSTDERFDAMRKALLCDVYLTSINAISEDGQLVNVDGVGNRIAAMSFGPKSVIAIVGMNKICKTIDDALIRVRTYAAPLNAIRLSLENTPCAITGTCADCNSDECICSYIVTTRRSRIPGRIKIILVGKPLGY